jgi:hypothetical protein
MLAEITISKIWRCRRRRIVEVSGNIFPRGTPSAVWSSGTALPHVVTIFGVELDDA